MNAKIAEETRFRDAPGFHAETVPVDRHFGRAQLETITALMWNAMHEYALSLAALGTPGLHGQELQAREAACRDMRVRFLQAKAAVDTLSALNPASRPVP